VAPACRSVVCKAVRMPDFSTVVWCGLAARGAAWCEAGRRAGVRACVGERAACACAQAEAKALDWLGQCVLAAEE